MERQANNGEGEVNAIVAAIDRPQVTTQRLSTTLRAPVGQTMLIGGMTFEGKPQANDPNLYLFVTVAIQELRDDTPKKPAAEADKATEAEKEAQDGWCSKSFSGLELGIHFAADRLKKP